MACHVQSMPPCSPSSTSTIPAYDSDIVGTESEKNIGSEIMGNENFTESIGSACLARPFQDPSDTEHSLATLVKNLDKPTKPKDGYSKNQISKQPRMCAYEHCPSPMHSNKWRVVTPQTSAGGRDWLPLLGMTLCDSCYSTYRKHATFVRSVRTAEGWARFDRETKEHVLNKPRSGSAKRLRNLEPDQESPIRKRVKSMRKNDVWKESKEAVYSASDEKEDEKIDRPSRARKPSAKLRDALSTIDTASKSERKSILQAKRSLDSGGMPYADSRRMSITMLDREDASYDLYDSMMRFDGPQELSNNETEAWSPDDFLDESSEGNEVLMYQDYEAIMDNMSNLVGSYCEPPLLLEGDDLA